MTTPVEHDYRIGEPAEFPAPPPEVMAELRQLLPPVEVSAESSEARDTRGAA